MRRKYANVRNKKARVRGTFVEHVRRDELLRRWDGCCGICGHKVNPKSFEVDHIIPASKGGTHCYANTQPAHPACNRLKGDLMPEDVRLLAVIVDAKRQKHQYLNVGNYSAKHRPSGPSAAY